MRRTLHLGLIAAMAFTALAVEGEAPIEDHPCYDATSEQVVYNEDQVWFHAGDTGVGNADGAAPWDNNEPKTSVTGGAGAAGLNVGTATLAAGTEAEHNATFTGTFTGCLDTMLLEVYSFDPTNRTGTGGITGGAECLPDCVPTANPATMDVGLIVEVDGQPIYSAGPIEITTEFASEGFGPNRNLVAVNLAETMELYSGYEMLTLDGEHTVTVKIRNWYVNTGHGAFVWDTSEVPSGLTFNGEIPEGVATF